MSAVLPEGGLSVVLTELKLAAALAEVGIVRCSFAQKQECIKLISKELRL